MKVKKILALALAGVMTLSMGMVVSATNQDASFTKTYNAMNDGTESPEETFTFSFTGVSLTNSNSNLGVNSMPAINNSSIKFEKGEAGKEGALKKAVSVALKDVTWPGVGVYIYDVREVSGNTAGVTYDDNIAKLKVTVAYDQGTDTYYTAFVTMSLEDEDANGITDVKTGGFTNVYSAGALAVSKTVTGKLGDITKEFRVKVEFNAPESKEIKSVITYDDYDAGSTELKTIEPSAWTNGKATVYITLADAQTVTFNNIPYYVTYTVEEDDYTAEADGGYEKAVYTFSDVNKEINSEKDTVNIMNKKDIDVDTGINLDNLPYILLLCIAVFGAAALFFKKRSTLER